MDNHMDLTHTHHVLLTVRGTQTDLQGEKQVIELMAEGQLRREGAHVYLSYQESEFSGVEGVSTMLDIEPGCVTLHRNGDVHTSMVFVAGHRYQSMYETPFGSVQLGVLPSAVYSDVVADEGEVTLQYQLDFGGRFTGKNTLHIAYKTRGKETAVMDTQPSSCS